MKKTLRHVLTALCAAALTVSVLAGCSGGDSALYRWKASTAEKDAGAFTAQLAAGERTNEAAVIYTEKGEEAINIHSFPAQAEGLNVDITTQIKTKDLGAADLALTYACKPGQELTGVQVYVSGDGTAWSEQSVGIRSTKIAGSGTDSAGNTVVYYEAHTENLLPLSAGEEIKGLRLAAEGALALCELSVNGYANAADFEAAVPERTVPVSAVVPNEAAGRTALLAAVKNSAAEEDLGRALEALALAGITISEVGLDLLDVDGIALAADVTNKTTDDVKMLFTYMYERNLMTEEKEAKLLADYETFEVSSDIVWDRNTPQQLFRGYAALQSGDLLLRVTGRGSELYLVQENKTVILEDGVSIDPDESKLTYITAKGEKKVSYYEARRKNQFIPLSLTALSQEMGAAVDVAVTGGEGARVTLVSGIDLTGAKLALGSVTAEAAGHGKVLVCTDAALAGAVKALTDGTHELKAELTTALGGTITLSAQLEAKGGKASVTGLTTTAPAGEDNEKPESDAGEVKSLKALVIGDKFTRSGMEYLYKILKAEGYNDITLGLVYSDGATMSDYLSGVSAETTYTFGRNERDFWESMSGCALKTAVQDRDWDYIVLQPGITQKSDFAEDLKSMVTYLNAWKTNPDAKIGWHLSWAYETGHANLLGRDPTALFADMAKAAKDTALANDKISFVVPAGTAMMNVRSSFMGESVQKDGYDANELGRLIAGYAWYAALTGNAVEQLSFDDAFLVYLSSAQEKVVLEALNNAIKTPFQITASTYPTEPEQYTAVIVDGETRKYMPGDTVTISANEVSYGQRAFQKWTATKGEVTFADAKAAVTTFKMPAQDVEIRAVYANESTNVLQVGFGRVDVTPTESVSLAGNFDTSTRKSTGPLAPDDRLNVTAIALSDGTHTNVVMTTDFIRVPTAWAQQAQKEFEARTGLPGDCLTISATHTHSAPDIGDAQGSMQEAKQITSVHPYFYVWLEGIVDAAEQALADLQPVSQTKVNSTIVPGMNWMRHWRHDSGVMNGTNFTVGGGAVKGFVRETDQEMQLVRFVRDDAKDVVLINWQGHPTYFGGFNTEGYFKFSADYCGVMYRYLEQQDDDCNAAFFLGASGNVQNMCNMTTVREKYEIPTQSTTPEWYGTKMGDYALEAMQHMTTVETGEVDSMRMNVVAVECLPTGGGPQVTSTREIEQDVITVGSSIAFVAGGYEMFDTIAMDIKGASPYDITFILTSTQGHEYMPNWQTHNYTILGGPVAYEAWLGSCTNVAAGTAEDLRDSLSAMLDILYAK